MSSGSSLLPRLTWVAPAGRQAKPPFSWASGDPAPLGGLAEWAPGVGDLEPSLASALRSLAGGKPPTGQRAPWVLLCTSGQHGGRGSGPLPRPWRKRPGWPSGPSGPPQAGVTPGRTHGLENPGSADSAVPERHFRSCWRQRFRFRLAAALPLQPPGLQSRATWLDLVALPAAAASGLWCSWTSDSGAHLSGRATPSGFASRTWVWKQLWNVSQAALPEASWSSLWNSRTGSLGPPRGNVGKDL